MTKHYRRILAHYQLSLGLFLKKQEQMQTLIFSHTQGSNICLCCPKKALTQTVRHSFLSPRSRSRLDKHEAHQEVPELGKHSFPVGYFSLECSRDNGVISFISTPFLFFHFNDIHEDTSDVLLLSCMTSSLWTTANLMPLPCQAFLANPFTVQLNCFLDKVRIFCSSSGVLFRSFNAFLVSSLCHASFHFLKRNRDSFVSSSLLLL